MIPNISQGISTSMAVSRASPASTASEADPNPGAAAASTLNTTQTRAAPGGQTAGVEKDLAAAVKELNSNLQAQRSELAFHVDDDSGQLVVKVVDSGTHEVIRQIPSEEVLSMARHLRESDTSSLLDTRA